MFALKRLFLRRQTMADAARFAVLIQEQVFGDHWMLMGVLALGVWNSYWTVRHCPTVGKESRGGRARENECSPLPERIRRVHLPDPVCQPDQWSAPHVEETFCLVFRDQEVRVVVISGDNPLISKSPGRYPPALKIISTLPTSEWL